MVYICTNIKTHPLAYVNNASKIVIKKLYNEAACLIEDSLVIADLHIGIEREFSARGISLPPSVREIKRKILDLLEISGASRLIILGDLKHNIPKANWHEYRHVSELIEEVSKKAEVVLVKGNHDSLVEHIVPELKIVKRLDIGEVTLSHGHITLCETGKYVLIAHSHPAILFRDSLGASREKAWIEAGFTEKGKNLFEGTSNLVVMPAFSPLISGIAFNSDETPLGPLFNHGLVDIENAGAYLLDSTYLGRIKDLR